MDPNENLRRQRALLAAARKAYEAIEDGEGTDADDERLRVILSDLSEETEAMDEWLSKGGALPNAWAR